MVRLTNVNRRQNYYIILFIILLAGCGAEQEESVLLEDLPVISPVIQLQIDQAGEHYFGHLGYTSVTLDDGSVFLPDRELGHIFVISLDGDLRSLSARDGRGPGEVLDPHFISNGLNNSILVYDQMNKKVLRFNSNGEFEEEFFMPLWEAGQLSEIYETDEKHFITIYRSLDYLGNMDLEPEAYMVVYNRDSEEYIHDYTIDDHPYARLIVNNQPRGGRMVPHAGNHLRAFHPGSSDFYSFWSMENEIAQMSASLDTLESITFELEKQRLSSDEIIAIREDSGADLWRSMQHLLPDYKAVADDFKVDHRGNLWLKLNHRSEFQQWLVLNKDGEKQAMIQLPKEGMLTHISEHHIGVRMDSHQFALFDPVDI